MVSEKTKKILSHLILAGFLLLIMIAFTQIIGLGRTGFDSELVLKQFYFYAGPAIGFLLGILIFFFIEILITSKDSQYGDSISFASSGERPAILKKMGAIKLLWLSLIIFSIFGLYIVYTNQTFVDFGQLEQQFAVVDSILFSAALIPAAENLGAAFVFATVLFSLRYWARKRNVSKNAFTILAIFLGVVTFGLYGVFNHLLRYGSSDVAIISVFVFWAIGGLITVLTGSFIPFWIMHFANNLFIDLTKYFSDDLIYGGTIGVILALTFGYFIIFKKKKEPSFSP